jgi:hypothetical protein
MATRTARARAVPPDTREIGTGPLRINVTLCRAMGWQEQEIQEVSAHLDFLARDHAERCADRQPHLFKRVDGVVVFLGELPRE